MRRRLVILGMTALGLALGGCGTAPHRDHMHSKFLRVINNTAGTVTMKSCPAHAAQAQDCSAAARIAPRHAADFPLAATGSLIRLVVITGHGGQPACFPIPPTSLRVRSFATIDVTDAQPGNCIGPQGSSATGS